MSTMAPATPTLTAEHWIPRQDSSDEDKKAFVRKIIDDKAQFRRWTMLRFARNGWFYRGRHWILEPRELRAGSTGQYYFAETRRRTENGDDVPMPVSNMIGPAVDNEVARLGRREYEAQTETGKGTPDEMNAARVAKDYLEWSHRVKKWPAIREAIGYDLSRLGTATLKTCWDESTDDLYRIGVTTAVKCASCPTVLSSPMVPNVDLAGLKNAEYSGTGEEEEPAPAGQAKLNVCPTCDMPHDPGEITEGPEGLVQGEPQPRPDLIALQPYDVGEEEAENGIDALGRPLGEDVPRGDSYYEVVSQFDLFPEGGGMGVECDAVKIMGQRTVKGLDWIEARVPEWAGKLVKEQAVDLMRSHPTFGERGFSGGVSAESTYPNHAFFEEVHIEPMGLAGLEKGLSIIKCGDNIQSRPLCVEVQKPDGKTAMIRRVKYQTAVCKRIEGEFWGRTEVDDLIPLNRRLNRLDCQVEMLREGGIVTLWLPSDVELYPRDDVDGPFKMMEYDGPQGWTPKDAQVNADPLTGTAYMPEREAILADMQKAGFPPDISLGIGKLNDLNTSALMLVSEESAVKRGPRERGLIAMFESAWTHDLELTWAFRKEDTELEVLNEAGRAERKSFVGADILGQCQVTVTKSAGYDQTIYKKEAVKEAIEAQALVLDTPLKRMKYFELANLPQDMNEDEEIQVKQAESAWSTFLGKGAVPALDPSIQDHFIRFQVFGKRWQGDECTEMREGCNFDETVLPAIYGWEQKLAQVDRQEAVTRPIYGNQDPATWPAVEAQGKALLAAKAKFDTPPPQDPRMPPQPPPPAPTFPPAPTQPFLPEAQDRRIYAFWRRLLGQAVQDAPTPAEAGLPSQQPTNQLVTLLKMRAVIEAHRQLGEAKKSAAMGGAPVLAAPGGAQSPHGLEPAPGSGPAMPGVMGAAA
jgi:hypothetical protein